MSKSLSPPVSSAPQIGDWRRSALPSAVAIGIVALMFYAYRGLTARPFAADDYQWLLNVHDLTFGQVLARAFDPAAQDHFYRPLVWLLFWAQTQVFGLDPRGFHGVSLGLHLLNVTLLSALVWRLHTSHWGVLRTAGFLALHPAPFEAVVWISAQSELLAAGLLLVAAHLWLTRRGAARPWSYLWPVLATGALALALLTKESAVIGLPLLLLLDWPNRDTTAVEPHTSPRRWLAHLAPFALPALLTAGYLWLQAGIESRNYLLQNDVYGVGPQLVLNPLLTLALAVAPLRGSEHADAPRLIWRGAALALLFVVLFLFGRIWLRRTLLALLLTLLPTAPFVSPPDSRYLYLPVMAVALLVGLRLTHARKFFADNGGERRQTARRWFNVMRWLVVLAVAWFAVSEIHAREGRFAAATGPGGSLWRLASNVCPAEHPQRILVVEPPLAAPHAEAIVRLACGPDVQPLVIGRAQVAEQHGEHALVVAFPNGSAELEQQRP